ncbi:MAG: hypothetical protein P8J87_11785, partial [Verrucomicrobiales bacterium]|nr:hypothetical protein [Verrucomicrobiales bacterium]
EEHRALWAESFVDLLQSHEGFVGRQGFWREDYEDVDPEALAELMQKETRQQIDHNLDEGLIKLSGEGTFRYSWRGMFFLWFQFLKDMVRLS